jgi:hypothetical protein
LILLKNLNRDKWEKRNRKKCLTTGFGH